jgi:hypothetical protein
MVLIHLLAVHEVWHLVGLPRQFRTDEGSPLRAAPHAAWHNAGVQRRRIEFELLDKFLYRTRQALPPKAAPHVAPPAGLVC